MTPIEPPDFHHLRAAAGWAELGNLTEAEAEFARINPALREHPDVLEVRWVLYATATRWVEGLEVASALVRQAPEHASGWLHRAYALRRAPGGGLQQAWDALEPAAEKFPDEPTIPYNLACYACQLNRLEDARQWLERATRIAGKTQIQKMALADSDLEPLWAELREA
jgi:tetratricopeptide (TPR) repeat protein